MFKWLILLLLVITTPLGANNNFNEAINLFKQRNYDESRIIFEILSRQDKENDRIYYYLGRLELIENDYKEAIKYFQKAIDRNENESNYHYWLVVAIMRKIPYSNFFGKMTNSMKMMKELKKAIELDSTDVKPRMMGFNMFVHSYGKGPFKKEDIIKMANDIQKIDSIRSYIAFANIYYYVTDEQEKVEEEYIKAMSLASDSSFVISNYADYLFKVRRYDEAILLYENYLQKNPADINVKFDLGVTYIISGKNYKRAQECFENCLNLKSDYGMPSKAMIHWSLGLAYYLLGQNDKAEKEWETVKTLDKDFKKVLEAFPQIKKMSKILKEKKQNEK
ncbi:MAG: tetratricopeptide repeat protein [Candidatus Cloacimonetes bacterium]|nr:tetratricopeptide repeat protein [Candidatus Cloacimonadota bacterium]MBL7086140.1 tetratricopeptide repeat protein [Candidatus Cloacimonadota bacterium]